MSCFVYIPKILIATIFLFPVNDLLSQNSKYKEYDSLLSCKSKQMVLENVPQDKIILWNQQMLQKMEKENYPRGIIWAHINLANYYWNSGDTEKSIEHLNAAEKLSAENKTDFYTIARIYQEYSQVFYVMDIYDTGLKYNSKAAYYGNRIENKDKKNKFLSYVYSVRANFHYETKNPDSALIYLQKSSGLYKSASIFSTIANHYIEYKPNQDSAKLYLSQALELLNEQKDKINSYRSSIIFYYYGQYYYKEKEYGKSIEYLEKALSFTNKFKNPVHLQNIYKLMTLCYKNLRNTEKEKEYLEKYTKLTDSMKLDQSKGMDLTLKKIQNEKDNETEKSRRKNNILLSGAFILAVSIIFLYYLYYIGKKRKKIISEKEEVIYHKDIETKILEKKVSGMFEVLVEMAKKNDKSFLIKFQEVYPGFIKKLLEINPDLTQSDLIFSAYIFLGFSSKEIASYTYTEHRSMQTKKTRLRRKLNLDSDIDLYIFFKSGL